MNIKSQTCCFTGHRKIPPNERERIAKRLRTIIIQLVKQGVIYFGAGGALGFDTLAALTVLELRKTYPQIRLILVLPCPEQTAGWHQDDAALYEQIKSRCDKIVYTAPRYTHGCMHRRNRHLVDHSSICVCYLTDNTGGTAYTVSYARENGLRIINIANGQV